MKVFIAAVIIMTLLSACSSGTGKDKEPPETVAKDEFTQNVTSGKQAMKNEYYRAALHYLERAKIDKPTDKDLEVLMKMAKDGVRESLQKMKPRSSFAEKYADYEQLKISQGEEPSWREWELDRLNQNSKRDQGVDKNGKTFEEYVADAEIKQTEPGKLNYESLLDEWLMNYDH